MAYRYLKPKKIYKGTYLIDKNNQQYVLQTNLLFQQLLVLYKIQQYYKLTNIQTYIHTQQKYHHTNIIITTHKKTQISQTFANNS